MKWTVVFHHHYVLLKLMVHWTLHMVKRCVDVSHLGVVLGVDVAELVLVVFEWHRRLLIAASSLSKKLLLLLLLCCWVLVQQHVLILGSSLV